MAYEQKAGSGTLFKNDRKEKDTHPDYRGTAMLPDGTEVWLSMWIKEGQKGKFFSLSMQPKEQQTEEPQERAYSKPKKISDEAPFNDEIPFD